MNEIFRVSILIILYFLFSNNTIVIPPLLGPSEYNSVKPNQIYDPKDQKGKGKPRIPTSWGGGALTQEEKIVSGFPVTVFSLSNGAWIKHRNVTLKSYLIEVIGADAVLATLKGGVRVEDPENRITLTASNANYDKFQELVVLDGRPTLYYYNNLNKLTKVTAPFIKRYMGENKVVLEGGVILQDPDFTILSDNAVYYEKDKLLVLENYPLFFGDKKFLTGENASYNNDSKVTSLENKSIIVIQSTEVKDDKIKKDKTDSVVIPENEPVEEKKPETKEVTSILSADKMESLTAEDPENNLLVLSGNAKIYREDFEFHSEKLLSSGKTYKTIFTEDRAVFWEKENNIRMTGDLFEHFEETNYTHVTKNPYVEFLSKEGEVTSTLKSVELERFAEKKEIVARGNVVLESENGIIRGQYATFYEEDKKLIVEGKPTLQNNSGIINCGKITIFTEDNRMIISDGIGAEKVVK
ncbi:MAG: hypothetical protein H7A24_07495 [Leptospiraceae bacterium]|nr:hypothetical protein [Leptospiraceae bacterium]MCP5511708.1 hypothetical protein [Leptospiraceae bacterium]